MDELNKEKLETDAAELLRTVPAATLAAQVVMLSSTLDLATMFLKKFGLTDIASQIKETHKKILAGPEAE